LAANVSKEYQEFAKVFKDIPDLIFAEMDTSMNEVKGQNYKSIPTMVLFPKEGEHAHKGIEVPHPNENVEENEAPRILVEFLNKHSTVYQAYCKTN